MEKILKLYTYVDGGVNDTPFPNAESPIEIGQFRYDAKRMGGAPTITASVDFPSCLDGVWTDAVYALFNGEKYYLKQTPTSSYNNESTMYRHDLELVSERVILDNVYFFDAVVGNPQGEDKPVSDSTKVVFFGNIHDFVARLNSSLEYSGLDYTVVVDSNITTEEKMISFEDQFFSNVLQEIYNTYEVPYYFEGKTIHIGWAKEDDELPTFSYGVDDALISITKNNANYKIVNRATGTGSSDNIPFYYPNNSPKGEIEAEASNNFDVKIVNYDKYANNVELDGVLRKSNLNYKNLVVTHKGETTFSGQSHESEPMLGSYSCVFSYAFEAEDVGEISITFDPNAVGFREFNAEVNTNALIDSRWHALLLKGGANPERPHGSDIIFTEQGYNKGEKEVKINIDKTGQYIIAINVQYVPKLRYENTRGYIVYSPKYNLGSETGWVDERGKPIDPASVGLQVSDRAEVGDTITQTLVKYVKTSQNLMPSIYRETDGAERFYNATRYPFEYEEGYELKSNEYILNGFVHNDSYKNEDGEYIKFNNPFIEGRPKEHIISVEDIKPTIEGTEVNGLRIDMFSEFAYDEDDNDETYEDEEGNVYFKHPYFYGKLRVMDFNLFDHAIEQQPMTISFTSGDSGACNFEIGVTEEYPQKNPVQVDDNGNLVRDKNGMIVAGVEGTQQSVTEFQDRQQDTSKYEVWIALRKEEDTYGILMPQVAHRPKACTEGKNDGDTFVILGINLPKSYILNAEKRLEAEIIKYMKDNNDEKFTFSIGFSRIYFEENPDILQYLSENSKITITYDGNEYDLYVSSFSYNMSEGDVLPEIRVELDETLKVSQNALQNAISQVKSELGAAIRQVSAGVAMQKSAYIQKQADDEAHGMVNFTKGIKFGEGGKVEVMDNNSAKLTIEYLEVTKKASFTSLEIQEKTHVGGQILVTPAAVNCGEVEELEDAYRCYFQTKGADGDEIFNQFAIGDQAICQTFNAWGSKYYWRLVTGVGEDYIDLSKTDCDEDSGIPSAGDKIIQMGNREDEERQNAIVIAAYGDGSPYIIQYKGINAFEIPDDKIVTKLSSTENIFTGKVHMEIGSDGLGDMQEFVDLQALAGRANTNATNAQNKANSAMSVADKAQQSADTANTNALQAGESANAASEKAEEAIEKAEAAQEGVDNLEIGGTNLLRNSGFTGDYLSEQLADEKVLESAAELYSSPLDHWSSTATTVIDSDNTISGKAVSLTLGTLSQDLYYNTVVGAEYVLSFKAKGEGILSFTIGDASGSVSLTSEMTSYEIVVTPTASSDTFRISNATCILGNLKLEKGNKATSWSASPLDNTSDRAYYQSMKYIQNAFEGATDISGGLVLTEQIQVGNYDTDKKEWVKMNGGMSGVYESDHDVAFWAGGNINQAIETVMMYEDNPTLQPTEEQLASMAKFVVTHGGRAILNDVILRGTVYAIGGEFAGKINVDAPNVDGRISLDDYGLRYFGIKSDGTEYTRVSLGGTCQGASVVALAPNALSQFCTNAAVLAVGDDDTDAIHARGDVICYDGSLKVNKIGYISNSSGTTTDIIEVVDNVSFNRDVTLQGTTAGLKTKTRVITSTGSSSYPNELSETDFSVLVNATSGTYYIKLPSSPLDGQEYWLETKGADMSVTSSKSMWSHWNATLETSHTFQDRGVIRFKYYEGANQWTYTWVESH